MNNIAESFKKASFGGIEFPVSKVRVRGGLRYHVHEFPHSPGGESEKLGRKLYTMEFTAYFHDLPDSSFAAEFPDLYPKSLNELMDFFELAMTKDLLVPNIGKIQAHATDWDREFDFERALSGEGTVFQFLEDQDRAGLLADRLPSASVPIVTGKLDELTAQLRLAQFKSDNATSIFQKINDAVTAVKGVQGIADAHARLIEGKIRAVADLCSYADSQLEEMQNPENHFVITALKDLWLNARELADNISNASAAERRTYEVKKLMTVGQVATAIYGGTERSVEIMQLNPIDDPLAIPEGTMLSYLVAA